MTRQAQPACVTDMDYGDGDATFRCGDYSCWTTAHASDHGVGNIIEGADYYDCDNRYAKGNDAAYQTWEKCVVDTDQRMSVLSKHECNMRGWMPGSEIGGF